MALSNVCQKIQRCYELFLRSAEPILRYGQTWQVGFCGSSGLGCSSCMLQPEQVEMFQEAMMIMAELAEALGRLAWCLEGSRKK